MMDRHINVCVFVLIAHVPFITKSIVNIHLPSGVGVSVALSPEPPSNSGDIVVAIEGISHMNILSKVQPSGQTEGSDTRQ